MSPADVLVLGAGAVGSFYGGKLAQAGAVVDVVSRGDYETVKSRGVAVHSVLGDFHFQPRQVFATAAAVTTSPRTVLVCLKVLPQIDLPDLLSPLLGPETSVVLLQNGIDIERPLATRHPQLTIIRGLAFVCINRLGPGVVAHLDYGRLVLGRYPRGESAVAQQLSAWLTAGGVPCELTADVVAGAWRKLMWNAAFNAISVAGHGLDTGQIVGHPERRELAQAVMEEVRQIAVADGHQLPATEVAKLLADTDAMKPYRTSMLLDFEAGRELEVEAILGNAVRIARRLGVPVPRLQSLYALLGTGPAPA